VIYTIFAAVFGGLALLCVLGAWLRRSKRTYFTVTAICAAIAAGSAYAHAFWTLVVFVLATLAFAFALLDVLTNSWRLRVGLTVAVLAAAVLSLFPTYHDEYLCAAGRSRESCPEEVAKLEPEARAAFQTDATTGDKGMTLWLTHNIGYRMVRGLDLAGGIRLVYEVGVRDAIKDKRDRYYDDLRARLTKAYGISAGDAPTFDEMQRLGEYLTISKPRDQINTVEILFKNAEDSKKHLTNEFLAPFLYELNVVRSTDGSKVTFIIRSDAESAIRSAAVGQAKETIDRRINSMGVKEPSISSRGEEIIVEIPGDPEKNAKYFDEIVDIISKTARLEFKMLEDDPKYPADHPNAGKPIDGGFFKQFISMEGLPEGMDFLVENAPIGPGRTQANYFGRLEKLKGESLEEALTRIRAWAKSEAVASKVDDNHEIGFEKVYRVDEETGEYEAVGWRTYYLRSSAELTGDMVRDARADADQTDAGLGQWFVTMNLNPRGAELFEKTTEINVKRRFAIILDGVIESAPVINEKIGGGTARITMGGGGVDEQHRDAKKLELVLRSGALPAPISQSNKQAIGASLGSDSISEGLTAALIGSLAVVSVIFVWYRRAGLIANLAVFFNLVLQMAILAMFSASMTLPGIAGLALTVGMSVDANVLINERIKEELAAGRKPRSAVALGYDRAFSAIFDGHVTAFITGLILAQYGSGPIKGFAVTLIVGMLCNLFTGVVVTRLFFEFWVRGRDVKLSLGS
jgi:preprotein translocase subunit SecD